MESRLGSAIIEHREVSLNSIVALSHSLPVDSWLSTLLGLRPGGGTAESVAKVEFASEWPLFCHNTFYAWLLMLFF